MYLQIDGNRNIFINKLGLMLKDAVTPVRPEFDEETGLAFILMSVPGKDPNDKIRRYVHVEVFRTFGNLKNAPKLEPEDVLFMDENPKNLSIDNLMLSDSGKAKVYGGEGEPTPLSPPEEGKEEVESETEEPTPPEGEKGKVKSGEGEKPAPQSPPEEGKEEESSPKLKFVYSAGKGYDLTDLATDEIVAEEFGVTEKPRKKIDARKLADSISAEYGVEVEV